MKTCLLLTIMACTAANAATVAWTSSAYTTNGSVGQNLDTGIFDSTGTLVIAENLGGAAVSFDGINFTASTRSFNGGNFGQFHQNTSNLSRTGVFGNAGSSDTVSLSGLTSGRTYSIQVLLFDGRGDGNISGRSVEFDGIDQGQYANGVTNVTWGDGLLVTGTFLADATTQDFTVEAFNNAGASQGGQANALIVRDTTLVPEPSSTALLGLGFMGLVLRRRR